MSVWWVNVVQILDGKKKKKKNKLYQFVKQVLELMQMHPKERLRRVILTASWFIAIDVGQFSLRIPRDFPGIFSYFHEGTQ